MRQVHLKVHNLNYESVFKYFLDSELDVNPTSFLGSDGLSVSFEVRGEIVTLVHKCVEELTQLPSFLLDEYQRFGRLAHVLPIPNIDNFGSICINHQDSVSINFERPELAFEESMKRHIALLKSLIEDPKFNDDELLREFDTNWQMNTEKLLGNSIKTLFCELRDDVLELFQVFKPEYDSPFMSVPCSYIALPKSNSNLNINVFFNTKKRKLHKEAIACVFSLQSIEPALPSNLNILKEWLCDCLSRVNEKTQEFLTSKLYMQRAKEFWLILNVQTPSGVTWFGIRLINRSKKAFPNSITKIQSWKLKPLLVKVFNKELMMPRSGANCYLDSKKVLLVGCGSVGSELADKLGAMGIGNLDITDPDSFTTSNLYRHTLNRQYIGCSKSIAVKWALEAKYPWIKINAFYNQLLEFRDSSILNNYDLIVIAVGSPTHERIFHDFLVRNKLRTTVIYTWLEGYGIGGHAVLDIPTQKGCLRCAYVDPETGVRGLASNLNFLKSDQNIVKNYAGCGEMFIPYGAMSSTQTALIAGDLAMKYLDGKLIQSTKVSWKGDDEDANAEGLKLTDRYNSFATSLKKQRLYHPVCDVCNNEEITLFQRGKLRVILPFSVQENLNKFKQTSQGDFESAGLLIGHIRNNGDIFINNITEPKKEDDRTRVSFKLDAYAHQSEVDDLYTSSDKILGYLGTWHTHPQKIPTPSGVDIVDWKGHYEDNTDRSLFFIVVGLLNIALYTIEAGKVEEMYSTQEVCI